MHPLTILCVYVYVCVYVCVYECVCLCVVTTGGQKSQARQPWISQDQKCHVGNVSTSARRGSSPCCTAAIGALKG